MSTPSEPTVDSWFAARMQDRHVAITNEQLLAFKDLFNGTTSNPEELSEIASRIGKPHIKPWDECNIERLWGLISEAVGELTSQNDKLAALVIALQRLPDGQGVLGPDPWFHDLPFFNDHWTEVDACFRDLAEKDPDRQSNRRAYVNQNAFLAKITAQAGDVKVLLQQRWRGALRLLWALEETPWDESSPTYRAPYPPFDTEDVMTSGGDSDDDEDVDEDSDQDSDGDKEEVMEENGGEEEEEDDEYSPDDKVTVLDVLVPAAAQWIKYCPRKMYEQAMAGGVMETEREDNGTNFGTMKGWSLERWVYWRQRFEELSTMEDLEEGTRHIAKESVERMDAIAKEVAGQ